MQVLFCLFQQISEGKELILETLRLLIQSLCISFLRKFIYITDNILMVFGIFIVH